MPVVTAAKVQETAEGNLVHMTKDSDSISGISNTSSTRRELLRAKLDLEQCLLDEAMQKTKIARLRMEVMQEEEVQVILDQSDDRLERDLSNIMEQDRLIAAAAESKNRADAEKTNEELASGRRNKFQNPC